MPTTLRFEDHLDGLMLAASRLHSYATDLPAETRVPTAPEWNLLELVAHLGMVHRWATARIAGETVERPELWEQEGMLAGEPLTWLGQGVDALRTTLVNAPEDLEVPFFLPDAPPPRAAWARRQCHETTIHAVDALAAHHGRAPWAADTNIDPLIAADGIDEVLCGFAVRSRHDLASGDPLRFRVSTTDTEDTWTIRAGGGSAEAVRGAAGLPVEAELTGSAAQLYLALWNRGNEPAHAGPDVLAIWQARVQVVWS